MRTPLLVSLPFVLSACSALPAPLPQDAAPSAGDSPQTAAVEAPARDGTLTALDLHVGTQSLDNETYWDPLEEFEAFSLWYVKQFDGAWLGWETGLSISAGSEDTTVLGSPAEFSGELWEWTLGLHKSFLSSDAFLRPYIGAGLSLFIANAKLDAPGIGSANDGDLGLGFYARVGVPLVISRRLRLGVQARALAGADVDIAGASGDVDHTELSAFLGLSW